MKIHEPSMKVGSGGTRRDQNFQANCQRECIVKKEGGRPDEEKGMEGGFSIVLVRRNMPYAGGTNTIVSNTPSNEVLDL